MNTEKQFPPGMLPLGKDKFNFHCHEGVDCYMLCCKNVDMFLYPYDIICLKNFLNISSQKFLENYTRVISGVGHPYFPSIMLRLTEDGTNACPFLQKDGCGVYENRPSSCRTYPLERGVDLSPEKSLESDFYCMTNHEYCLGHFEKKTFTVKQWIRNQRLEDYNLMNDLWSEVDTLFSDNPWGGEGSGGPKQQIAFTACYDINNFRLLVAQHDLLHRFRINREQKRNIKEKDSEMLKFAFEWVKNFLGAPSSLIGL